MSGRPKEYTDQTWLFIKCEQALKDSVVQFCHKHELTITMFVTGAVKTYLDKYTSNTTGNVKKVLK